MVQGNALHDSSKLWVIRSGDLSIVSIMYVCKMYLATVFELHSTEFISNPGFIVIVQQCSLCKFKSNGCLEICTFLIFFFLVPNNSFRTIMSLFA